MAAIGSSTGAAAAAIMPLVRLQPPESGGESDGEKNCFHEKYAGFNDDNDSSATTIITAAIDIIDHHRVDNDNNNNNNKLSEIMMMKQNNATILDGKDFRDVPAKYVVPILKPYEYHVIGVCIDKRIVPGFRYRVRPIDSLDYNSDYLFDGKAVRLQSIGRGYCRRITFAPTSPYGSLNKNDNYFWSDSRPYGYAFQLEVVSVDEEYTLYSSHHRHPIGHLKIIKLQCPQEEIDHVLLDDKSVKKTVKVCFLAEVEWYYENEDTVISISGTAVCTKPKNGIAEVDHIENVLVGINSSECYTLIPGIDNRKRCIFVSGALCQDIPFDFTITGLEIYEMPVIGTYVDPRIIPGFYYRIRAVVSDEHLLDGETLLLQNIGMGYSKRFTFYPPKNQKNNNTNYFWTDSWPGGFGFELRAIRKDTNFDIYAKNQLIGHASVFRVDEPQREEKQLLIKSGKGTSVVKYVHVDVTCHVTFNMASGKIEADGEAAYDDHIMRISGVAVLAKHSNTTEAVLVRVEEVGLDSQLNLLFRNQHTDLVLYPTKVPSLS